MAFSAPTANYLTQLVIQLEALGIEDPYVRALNRQIDAHAGSDA